MDAIFAVSPSRESRSLSTTSANATASPAISSMTDCWVPYTAPKVRSRIRRPLGRISSASSRASQCTSPGLSSGAGSAAAPWSGAAEAISEPRPRQAARAGSTSLGRYTDDRPSFFSCAGLRRQPVMGSVPNLFRGTRGSP